MGKGDEVMGLGSGKKWGVKRMVRYEGELDYGLGGEWVRLRVEEEIEV